MSRKIKLKKAIAKYINKTYDNPEEEHEFSYTYIISGDGDGRT